VHTLLLQYRLRDRSALEHLLHELNLHDGVHATVHDGAPFDEPVVAVTMPDTAELVWSVRSTVRLFDAEAEELSGGHTR
jgi:hypothetical protein